MSRPVTRPSRVTSAQVAAAGVCVRCTTGEAVRCGVRVTAGTAVSVGTAVLVRGAVDVGTAVGVFVASCGGPAIAVAVCTAIAVAVCASDPGGVSVAVGPVQGGDDGTYGAQCGSGVAVAHGGLFSSVGGDGAHGSGVGDAGVHGGDVWPGAQIGGLIGVSTAQGGLLMSAPGEGLQGKGVGAHGGVPGGGDTAQSEFGMQRMRTPVSRPPEPTRTFGADVYESE